MSQEWSRVVSAEVKEEYMTLQGIQTYCSQLTSQNTKTVQSHLSLTLMRVKLVQNMFVSFLFISFQSEKSPVFWNIFFVNRSSSKVFNRGGHLMAPINLKNIVLEKF